MDKSNFPKEVFIELNGVDHFLHGRVVISSIGGSFQSEIDIVQKETGKIYWHVDILYNIDDPKEALDLSVFKLKSFIDEKNS